MNFNEALRLAVGSIAGNKLRALLTLLGVIIGITSVIIVLTLGSSLKTQLVKSLADSGANDFSLQVESRTAESGDDFLSPTPVPATSKITPELIDRLRTKFTGQIVGIPIGETSDLSGTVSPSDQPQTTKRARIHGVNPDFITMRTTGVTAGRPVTDDDVAGARPVAVVSPELVTALFGGDTAGAPGKSVDVEATNGQIISLTVIGVTGKSSGGGIFGAGGNETPALYIPWSLEDRLGGDPGTWTRLSVRPVAGTDEESFRRELSEFAAAEYTTDPDFTAKVTDMKKDIDSFRQVIDSLSIGLSVIAGISLLVGGIGVMNIMLVTVTERTREIGIRKALGARNRDIRLQFLVEAMIICLFGGVIGVLLGTALGVIGAKLMGTMVFPPIAGVLFSLGFSVAIGGFFGFYPAARAARLNPIEALRHE
ncbi:ABC transporter permease [Corynebacterium sp. CCM 9185]|uniref:ABC transporter permease n=1 Tax=Corynebacterium marambiense TaxID=2765364 RepID=A0ABS0VW66_9CORY|nr:ABC transporter permease [Corynebacterium marambiense]MBI9000990.1 ABC transporter permease [Corynebacterium marambiense]MCK7662739.1 ABC transporter permease [Corynebacterium marambiense]MCX7543223.1 ABC transporter permease [Corynebacterium marambiense]